MPACSQFVLPFLYCNHAECFQTSHQFCICIDNQYHCVYQETTVIILKGYNYSINFYHRIATNANTVETILHGSVGLLTARSGGHLVSLQCYVSPNDIFEEGTGAQLNYTDVNSKKTYLQK